MTNEHHNAFDQTTRTRDDERRKDDDETRPLPIHHKVHRVDDIGQCHVIRDMVKTEMLSVHSMKSGAASSRHHRTAARRHSLHSTTNDTRWS